MIQWTNIEFIRFIYWAFIEVIEIKKKFKEFQNHISLDSNIQKALFLLCVIDVGYIKYESHRVWKLARKQIRTESFELWLPLQVHKKSNRMKVICRWKTVYRNTNVHDPTNYTNLLLDLVIRKSELEKIKDERSFHAVHHFYSESRPKSFVWLPEFRFFWLAFRLLAWDMNTLWLWHLLVSLYFHRANQFPNKFHSNSILNVGYMYFHGKKDASL